MRKLFAVVKREYLQRLRSRMFIMITILGPVVMTFFAVAPALILSIRAGGPTKVAVVDQTGKLYQVLYESVVENAKSSETTRKEIDPTDLNKNSSERIEGINSQPENNVALEEFRPDGKPLDEIKRTLDARVLAKELDGYLILPANLLVDGKP